MNATQTALSIYGAAGFSRIQRLYTMYGYTITSPDYIAFIRPCKESNWASFNEDNHDAWFVEFVVGQGRIDKLIGMLPYYLPRIGWQRNLKGRFTSKFHNLDRLKSLTNN